MHETKNCGNSGNCRRAGGCFLHLRSCGLLAHRRLRPNYPWQQHSELAYISELGVPKLLGVWAWYVLRKNGLSSKCIIPIRMCFRNRFNTIGIALTESLGRCFISVYSPRQVRPGAPSVVLGERRARGT